VVKLVYLPAGRQARRLVSKTIMKYLVYMSKLNYSTYYKRLTKNIGNQVLEGKILKIS
jgi:hypothetical protein